MVLGSYVYINWAVQVIFDSQNVSKILRFRHGIKECMPIMMILEMHEIR
jgi:hypothetical protein